MMSKVPMGHSRLCCGHVYDVQFLNNVCGVSCAQASFRIIWVLEEAAGIIEQAFSQSLLLIPVQLG